MVVGIGLDIVSCRRVQAALTRFGERFLARILTERERGDLRGVQAEAVAARFAAKEAALKALGCGLTQGVRWRDVEVTHAPSGTPRMRLGGCARERGRALGVTNCHVSLTHEREHAAALVVLEGVGPTA